MKKEKKNCYNCGYRDEVVGSCHSKCKFDWANSKLNPPKSSEHGRKNGWYNFPLNYDPVWQESECEAHSEEADEKMIKEFSPLQNIFSIFGG